MIYGDCPNIACIGLEPSDDIDDWGKELGALTETFPKGTIVLMDLFGGTPCNQYLMNMAGEVLTRKNGQACAVAGVNLSMVLEAIGQRECAELKEISEILDKAGKEAVVNVLQKMKK